MRFPTFTLAGALVLFAAQAPAQKREESSPRASASSVLSPPSTGSLSASSETSAPKSGPLASAVRTEKPEWGRHFEAAGVRGTFLLYDASADRMAVYNPVRARTPFIPASTYKIPNSLIALETGAVRDESEVIAWDGVKRTIADWNRDHTMRTAFPASVVPFYQEVARRIGAERMQRHVDRIGYGNRDLSGGIDQFWLTGGLRITPEEQIAFLVRLARNQLPFSSRSMDIVKDIMVREKTDRYVLRGKTGWAFDFKPQVGWFVGWIEREGKPYFFAINIDIDDEKDAGSRLAITKAILSEEGLME